MNSAAMVGLGAGITQGLEIAKQGMLTAEQIKQNRDAARQKAQTHEQQLQQGTQAINQNDLALQQITQELGAMKKKMARDESYNAFSAHRETGDTKYLNMAIKGNPELQKAYPGVVNIDSPSTYSQEQLDKIGLKQEMLTNDPNRYVVAIDPSGQRKAIDMYGLYANTGYLAQMKKSDLDDVTSKATMAKSKTAEGTSEVTTGFIQDLQKQVEAGTLTPEQAFRKLTEPTPRPIAMGNSGTGNQKRDSFQQLQDAMDMLADPNLSDDERQNIKTWIQKTSTSASYAGQERSLGDLSVERQRAVDIVGSDKPDLREARDIQDQIVADLSPTEQTKVKKTEALVETNYNAAKGVDRILDKYLSGKTSTVVDADVIATANTWINKNTGREEQAAFKKVQFDTEAGMLLAGYIKELSGTAASDTEVQRLTNILLAGKYTDETYIKASMETFRDSLKEKNSTLLENYNDTLPYTTIAYGSNKKQPGKKDLSKYVTGGQAPTQAEPKAKVQLDDLFGGTQ